MSQAAVIPRQRPIIELLEQEFDASMLATALDLSEAIPPRLWERALLGPLREFLARPGKEFRARIVSLGWELGGGELSPPEELGLLVEMLHAGSLIVDDIEDQSPYRRGQKALHCLVGTPLALNAGNWLYFWPLVLTRRLGLSRDKELSILRAMNQAVLGCHYGQALDLSVPVTELSQREVRAVVTTTTRLKTGSLMGLAAGLGAIASGASEERSRTITAFGRHFGVALQMLDDLTGITDDRRCHKGHEDLLEGRPTWPWAWLANELDAVSYAHLQALGTKVMRREVHPEVLAKAIRARLGNWGKRRVRTYLEAATRELAVGLCAPDVLPLVEAEIARLEDYGG